MAIELDRDLAKDTSISILYSKLGILQYGRITRAYYVRGIPIVLDTNHTDGTIPSKAVDAVKAEIPQTTPHPNALWATLLARDYQYISTNDSGVHEVIVAYVFDSPLNPDFTLDCDSWVEQIESRRYKDGSGNWQLFKVDNYTANWFNDTDAYPGSADVLKPAYGTAPIFIPRRKWIVTKTASALTAGTVQGVQADYLRRTNSATIFGEAVGTVLCSRIATQTEPWLGRATIIAEFLVREEGWEVYEQYSSTLTNGVPPNVWPDHNGIAANGVKPFTVQPSTDLNTLLSMF